MEVFYEFPTQVRYMTENATYRYGIAYGYNCIDADNGDTFDIEEYRYSVECAGIPESVAWVEMDWVSLSDAICFGGAAR